MTTRGRPAVTPEFQLGEISGKLDMILVQMAADRAALDERLTKAEQRLDAVEEVQTGFKQDRSWLLGGAAAIATGISAVGAVLGLK